MLSLYKKSIFDNIHNYIVLTKTEAKILETAYYQRLRWITQLGFTSYIFPGATHTRFSHALGVMHTMDKILHSIGKSVPEEKLFSPKFHDDKTQFHRTMRLAALLHDIGTFPFSHTIELSYINHWTKQRQHGKTALAANHENLGCHIILNTDFEGGITRILKEDGIDPLELSLIVAGKSSSLLANQLMHSDVDADRMDYLLRDSHHTGVRLGVYDRDFLIKNMRVMEHGGDEVLCFTEAAINAVEYFLISRYSWYSQVINDGTGYKFDLIAAKIYEYFLENGMAYSFDDLIRRISQNPNEYFTFNDSYFMAKLHEYLAGRITHPMIRELSVMLAHRRPPHQLKLPPFNTSLVESTEHRARLVKEVGAAAEWLENELKKLDPKAWMITDIPTHDVMFTRNYDSLRRDFKGASPLKSRDSAKVVTAQGELKLLIDVSSSLMSILSQYRNFIPRIYLSDKTYELLEANKIFDVLVQKRFARAA